MSKRYACNFSHVPLATVSLCLKMSDVESIGRDGTITTSVHRGTACGGRPPRERTAMTMTRRIFVAVLTSAMAVAFASGQLSVDRPRADREAEAEAERRFLRAVD